MKVSFIGMGYIGLPTAIVAATAGIEVSGVDVNESVVERIGRGEVHIAEPGLQDLLKSVLETGRLKVSVHPSESNAYFIVVPTPFKDNHKPDLSYVEAATKSIIPLLKEGDLYVIESTSPVGTTEKMAELIFETRPVLRDKIHVAYCPERVLPGNVVHELVYNDRVIGGINEQSSKKAAEVYGKFVKGKLHFTDCRTAELCKLTENSCRDVQIAFANELSMICDKAGIDVWELINLANKHPRINILRPGCGVGGHCIAVDPYFITSEFSDVSKIIGTAREINNYKASWCAGKIMEEIVKFKEERHRLPSVAMMGLAFKPDIDDLRESPSVYITGEIIKNCADADIMIAEPNISSHKIFNLTHYKHAYEKSDIAVFLTSHKEFKELPFRRDKVILDFCGVFSGEKRI